MNKKLVNIIGLNTRFLSLIGSIVLFLILSTSLISSLGRIKMGDNLIDNSKIKVEKLKKENENLQKQLEITQSEEYLEKQLRDKLGLAKEGEIVLVLPEAEILRKLSPQIPSEDEIKPKPNWQKWLDLFI